MRLMLAVAGLAAFVLVLIFSVNVRAQAEPPPGQLGRHCIRTGPIPLDFCGCTWGAVYFRGQPVAGATVTLSFGAAFTTTLSSDDPTGEAFPYYSTTALDLGARQGDLLTLTVTFAGLTATRTFRAQPAAAGEQRIDVALEELGEWESLLGEGYSHTLLQSGNTLWAGGSAGLVAVDLTTGQSTPQALPWPSPITVRALTLDDAGRLWVGSTTGLAELSGNTWLTHPVPISGTVAALVFDPASGVLWAGGGTNLVGNVARYDGTWQAEAALTKGVRALTVDSSGTLWAGTAGAGAARLGAAGWELHDQIPVADNLFALLSDPTAGQAGLWAGGQAALTPTEGRSAASRFDLAAETWQAYTQTQSSNAVPNPALRLTTIYALALDPHGARWAGAAEGLFVLAGPRWLHHPAPVAGAIRTIAAGDQLIVAADEGVYRFAPVRNLAGGPTVVLSTTPALLSNTTIYSLTALAQDGDADGNGIVAWDWASDRSGPLCTSDAVCVLTPHLLAPGEHQISVRVQDDEGLWSDPALHTLHVTSRTPTYLPLIEQD